MPRFLDAARRRLASSVLSFLFVGSLTAGVDFGLLSALIGAGASPTLARIPAVLAALVVARWLNRTLTFQTRRRPSWQEFLQYAAAALAALSINVGLYWIALGLGAPVWAAFCIGTGCAAIFSFLRYRAILGDPSG